MTQHSPRLIERTYLSLKPAAGAIWPVAYSIALMMLGFMAYHHNWLGLESWLAATPSLVFQKHEYWRALTTIFVHADLEHFSANVLFFGGLSFLLYGYFGSWVFPVLSFAAGTWINFLALATYDSQLTLVGASGVVYFMAAFWLALYVGIERRLSLTRRWINSIAFTLVLLMPETFQPRVSYRTHAIGYGVGWLFGLAYFQLRKRQLRAMEVLRVVEPESDPESTDSMDENGTHSITA